MAYPKPLEFDDGWTGFDTTVRATLRRTFRTGASCKIILSATDMSLPVFVDPTTRDALIDWLVSQRESERAREQRPSDAPETRRTGE